MVGTTLAVAGLLHLVRLGRWAGDRTFGERLVLILHVGYAFVPLGFLFGAGAPRSVCFPQARDCTPGWQDPREIMTLAVMTRASLGHTGPRLIASLSTQAIYAAALATVLARICAVIETAHSDALLHLAAAAWSVAFFGFCVTFGPALLGLDKRSRKQARA